MNSGFSGKYLIGYCPDRGQNILCEFASLDNSLSHVRYFSTYSDLITHLLMLERVSPEETIYCLKITETASSPVDSNGMNLAAESLDQVNEISENTLKYFEAEDYAYTYLGKEEFDCGDIRWPYPGIVKNLPYVSDTAQIISFNEAGYFFIGEGGQVCILDYSSHSASNVTPFRYDPSGFDWGGSGYGGPVDTPLFSFQKNGKLYLAFSYDSGMAGSKNSPYNSVDIAFVTDYPDFSEYYRCYIDIHPHPEESQTSISVTGSEDGVIAYSSYDGRNYIYKIDRDEIISAVGSSENIKIDPLLGTDIYVSNWGYGFHKIYDDIYYFTSYESGQWYFYYIDLSTGAWERFEIGNHDLVPRYIIQDGDTLWGYGFRSYSTGSYGVYYSQYYLTKFIIDTSKIDFDPSTTEFPITKCQEYLYHTSGYMSNSYYDQYLDFDNDRVYFCTYTYSDASITLTKVVSLDVSGDSLQEEFVDYPNIVTARGQYWDIRADETLYPSSGLKSFVGRYIFDKASGTVIALDTETLKGLGLGDNSNYYIVEHSDDEFVLLTNYYQYNTEKLTSYFVKAKKKVDLSPLKIEDTSPRSITSNGRSSIRISGEGFCDGTSVWLQHSENSQYKIQSEERFDSPSTISVTVDCTGAVEGYWNLVVEKPSGQRCIKEAAIHISPPAENLQKEDPSITVYLPGLQNAWIDPLSEDRREIDIHYLITPADYAGPVIMEISDDTGEKVGEITKPVTSGGQGYITWDGKIDSVTVNPAKNPYMVRLRIGSGTDPALTDAVSESWEVFVGRPVIFVHGILSLAKDIENSEGFQAFSEDHYAIAVEYADNIPNTIFGNIPQFARRLERNITQIKGETRAEKVDIVAHSMGGLVSRYYIEKLGGRGDVGKLIMVQTPNHGSEWADLRALIGYAGDIKKAYTLVTTFGLTTVVDVVADELIPSTYNYAVEFGLDRYDTTAAGQMAPYHQFIVDLNGNERPYSSDLYMSQGLVTDKIQDPSGYVVIASQNLFTPSHYFVTIPNPLTGNILYSKRFPSVTNKGDSVVSYNSAKLTVAPLVGIDGGHLDPWGKQQVMAYLTEFLSTTDDSLESIAEIYSDNWLTSSEQSGETEANMSSEIGFWSDWVITNVSQSEDLNLTFTIEPFTTSARFLFIWDEGTLSLSFTAPNGTVTDTVACEDQCGHSIDAVPGTWNVTIHPVSIPGDSVELTAASHQINPVIFEVLPDTQGTKPGDALLVSVYYGSESEPCTDATVTATVKSPDESLTNLTLYDDGSSGDDVAGDGVYSNTFTETVKPGTYLIAANGSWTLGDITLSRTAQSYVTLMEYPDLTIDDITITPQDPRAGDEIEIIATVSNIGSADATNVSVAVYANISSLRYDIDTATLNIPAGDSASVTAQWKARADLHTVVAVITSCDEVTEESYSNNIANATVNVQSSQMELESANITISDGSFGSVPIILTNCTDLQHVTGTFIFNNSVVEFINISSTASSVNYANSTGLVRFNITYDGMTSDISVTEILMRGVGEPGEGTETKVIVDAFDGLGLHSATMIGSNEISLIENLTREQELHANFTANVRSGTAPLTVQFNDISTGNPASWSWTFGDGATSTDQHPVHTYTIAGTYTVNLTVSNAYGSDEKSVIDYITVGHGTVSITTSGGGNATIGGEITLSGTNTDSATTYLFLTGPGLNATGTNLVNLSMPVVNDNPSTFTTMDVEIDNSWEYRWDTRSVWGGALEEGTYTIYAVSAPRDGAHLSDTAYATATVRFQAPTITATASAATIAPGDEYRITGTATGNPANVQIWIFGPNYYGQYGGALEAQFWSVELDGTFECILDDTYTLQEGQYYVVVQHPVDCDFGVMADTATGVIYGEGITNVTLTSLQAADAATALINALDSPGVDDVYATLNFQVVGSTPQANFTANVTSGPAPLAVQFTDTSTGNPTAWLWDFGDGSTSSQQHPVHTYLEEGLYTVNLTISTSRGSDTFISKDAIAALRYGDVNLDTRVGLVDAFTILHHVVGDTNVTEPLALMQGDLHQNDRLDVGDAQIIIHYRIGLDSLEPRTSEIDSGSVDLAVIPGTATVHSGERIPINITLLDAENVGSYDLVVTWNPAVLELVPQNNITLQAGGVWNTTVGEVHLAGVLSEPADGNLTICTLNLTAVGSPGSSSLVTIPIREYSILKAYSCNSVPFTVSTTTVIVSEPAPVANFTANATAGIAPLAVQFTDTSTGDPTTWLWTLGDGSTSLEQHPTHTYTTPGNYTVTLTVGNANGNDTLSRAGYIRVSPRQDVLWDVPLSITSGTFGQTMTLGSAESATRGFDAGLDVPMPPDAPAAKKSIYFFCMDPTFGQLSADYKPPVDDANPEESWTLSIRSDEPVQVTWDTTLLAGSNLFLTWDNGTNVVDMKATGGTTLPAGSYSITISASTVQQMDLPLQAGWNLVSVPFSDAGYTDPQNSILAIYGYNTSTKGYETISRIESLVPGKAYWIASGRDCTVVVTGAPASPVTAQLRQGWNLIGSTAGQSAFSSITITPAGAWAMPFVYGYDLQTKGYAQITELQLGEGYWGAVTQDCTITLP